jgi:isopentenyl diphosphate isomerase/L-lactate dehydrogenase-like FMN-dependent dehydrogenase
MPQQDHDTDEVHKYDPDGMSSASPKFRLPMHLVHMTSREAEAATSALLEEKSFLNVLSGMSNNEIEFVSTRKQLHSFFRELEKAATQPIVLPVEQELGQYEIDEDAALIQATIVQQIVTMNPQAIDELPLVKVIVLI